MTRRVSTEGLTRAEVLAALYNAAGPSERSAVAVAAMIPGEAERAFRAPPPMTVDEAAAELAACEVDGSGVDYVNGRAIKVELVRIADGDPIRVAVYDREHGRGAAQAAIDSYRLRFRGLPPVRLPDEPDQEPDPRTSPPREPERLDFRRLTPAERAAYDRRHGIG